MIFSQPDQYGTPPNVAAVESYWAAFLARKNRGVHDTGLTVGAYISGNRWVADCSVCGGGIATWDMNPKGCCLSCGAVYKVTYPKNYRAAEEILEARSPGNRHWFPNRGETLQDLERENRSHHAELGAAKSALGALYPAGI